MVLALCALLARIWCNGTAILKLQGVRAVAAFTLRRLSTLIVLCAESCCMMFRVSSTVKPQVRLRSSCTLNSHFQHLVLLLQLRVVT
jgi:hypothetical protein